MSPSTFYADLVALQDRQLATIRRAMPNRLGDPLKLRDAPMTFEVSSLQLRLAARSILEPYVGEIEELEKRQAIEAARRLVTHRLETGSSWASAVASSVPNRFADINGYLPDDEADRERQKALRDAAALIELAGLELSKVPGQA